MDLKKILPTDGPPVEEVLKYVEKYKNEIIVIKYGGNVFIDRKIFDNGFIYRSDSPVSQSGQNNIQYNNVWILAYGLQGHASVHSKNILP